MVLVLSCNPPWQDHYGNETEQINMKLWDAIGQDPHFSTFVSLIETAGLDSIFQDEQVYTLFIPGIPARWPFYINRVIFYRTNLIY